VADVVCIQMLLGTAGRRVRVPAVCVCVCVCVRACVHACMHACLHVCVHACVHACMRARCEPARTHHPHACSQTKEEKREYHCIRVSYSCFSSFFFILRYYDYIIRKRQTLFVFVLVFLAHEIKPACVPSHLNAALPSNLNAALVVILMLH